MLEMFGKIQICLTTSCSPKNNGHKMWNTSNILNRRVWILEMLNRFKMTQFWKRLECSKWCSEHWAFQHVTNFQHFMISPFFTYFNTLDMRFEMLKCSTFHERSLKCGTYFRSAYLECGNGWSIRNFEMLESCEICGMLKIYENHFEHVRLLQRFNIVNILNISSFWTYGLKCIICHTSQKRGF